MLKDLTADNIYIVCGHTDMRKSIDGLAALVQQQFQLDLFTSSAFLFCGRRRDRMKVLLWEDDGFLPLSLPKIPSQKNRRKPENIVAEMNCAVTLKQKKSCIHFPKISGNAQSAAVFLCRFQKNTSPHGSVLSLRKSLRSHISEKCTNVNTAINTEIKQIL